MLRAECLEQSINVHETYTVVFKKKPLEFRKYLKVTKTEGRRKIISFSKVKCKGIGGEIMLAGTERIFSYTGDACRSVHNLVKLTLLETLLKQNWEVNHILVNLASYFIALWKYCNPCSTASMPWFPLWATVLSIAHRKCYEASVNCSFSSPLLQLCMPLLQSKHHCAPHHSTLQNSVTDFYLGRTCYSGSQILGCI